MNETLITIVAINLVLTAFLISKLNSKDNNSLVNQLRELLSKQLKENRTELTSSLKDNREEMSKGIDNLTHKLEGKLSTISEALKSNAKEDREQLAQSLKDFNELHKQKFNEMALKQDKLVETTGERLEKMRETVDEKLHKTLEERLGRSFKLVSERLEAVQKGLGEMQTLASGVGDLKKVLTNVKTRGVLGEIQLGNILEQIMAPEQYEQNVKTKKGSDAHVEFAIKLPGKGNSGASVYLPIDAKFPQEDFIRLQTAYDVADPLAIDKANKALMKSIKNFAKDIRGKYIDPPNTTDFGIMFLPIEGLFAEVARQPEMITMLQRDYKIIVAGPTTLAAMLNSLQMGFKTLAIQKRSSEVWEILSGVKTEFGKFGDVLERAQKKITEANNDLDKLVGTRTRAMMRNLKGVEVLPSPEDNEALDETLGLEE